MPSSIFRALGFLSRIPVSSAHFPADHQARDDAQFYPLAGSVIAVPATFIIAAAAFVPHATLLMAAIAIAALVIITGALHEDGLGDVADGFFATRDKGRILDIMRDPHLGTFGMLALVFSVTFRVTALTILIGQLGALSAALALMGVEAISRAAMVWHWQALPNARPDGKADRAGQPDNAQMWQAVAMGAAIMLICMVAGSFWAPAVIALLAAAACAFWFKNMCMARIGGHTGDTIGATQQITAIAALMTLAIASNLTN
ncbi:MAG: adenosylcobinamide-GDP ribazoletransferase [Pseudomonadota bacterium]